MKKNGVLCAVILLMFYFAGCATSGSYIDTSFDRSLFPSNVQELHIDSLTSGYLSGDEEIWYSVKTAAAGFLTIKTEGDIDTILSVYDGQRNIIAENDDWEDLNARIEIISKVNTIYLINLYGYGDTTGPYQISVSFRPMPNITDLRFGSSHNAYITNDQEHWYSVTANKTGVLNIYTTGGTDTFLEAYTAEFGLLRSDDDSGENTNAFIVMDVKEGETFYFKLRVYDDKGQYQITAQVNDYPKPVLLLSGTFIDAYINSGDSHWYSVRAVGGTLLVIETLGSTDTTLEVFTESYDSLEYNDDNWDGDTVNYNAKLLFYTPEDCTYIFRVRSYGSGPYRIFLSIEYVYG